MGGTPDMLKVVPAALNVVVLVNRGDVMSPSLARRVLDACLNSGRSEETPESPLATGRFRSRATGRVIQLLARDGQQMAPIGGTELPVAPDTDGALHPASIYGILKYSIALIGRGERPTRILFDDFSNRDELSAVCPGEGDAQLIAGRYRSDSTRTEVTIHPTADEASMKSVGQFGSVEYNLRCLADEVWRSDSAGYMPSAGLLTFDCDDGASRFNNQALHFQRVH